MGARAASLRSRAVVATVLAVGLFASCGGVSRDPLAHRGERGGTNAQTDAGGAGQAPGGSASASAGSSNAGLEGVGGDTQEDPAGGDGGANAGYGGTSGNAGQPGGHTNGGAPGAGSAGEDSGGSGATTEGGASGEGGTAGAAGSGNVAGMGNTAPISSTGLVYWFSADFGITEDGAISVWLDRSGNHAHATQDLVDLRPKVQKFSNTDLPAVVFDGQDDHLALPPLGANFEAGLTFFAVSRPTAEAGTMICRSMLEASNGSEADDIGFFVHRQAFTYEVGDFPIIGREGALVVGEPLLLDVTHTPDLAVTLFLNGLVTGSSTFALPATKTRHQNFLGRSLYPDCTATGWSGEIAEILLYARALPTEERQAVRRYLDEKWGCCLGGA
jgi:hypothetical protein